MDLLLFGGSFDPPHKGHLAMYRAALASLPGAKGVWVPAHRSPFKTGTQAAPRERLALTRAAVAALPAALRRRSSVSAFEIERGRAVYTYETLEHFANTRPQARLHFLMGGDAYAGLSEWKRPEQVRALARIVVGRRPGAKPPRGAAVLPGAFPDVSSTDLRARLLVGEDAADGLPDEVGALIRRRKLYGLRHHARLRKELKPGRWNHVLAVARLALTLARRHGRDVERAALAGLLHDCGRAVTAPAMPAYCRRRRIAVPQRREIARRQPMLLHAHIGAERARRLFGVEDEAVLSAIAKHTLGGETMSPLDRLLFTADACSEDRRYRGAKAMRRAALADLDEGFRLAVKNKIADVVDREAWLHPLGRRLFNEWVAA